MGQTIAEQVLDVEFTITENGTETPNVAMQFKDLAGNDIDHPVAVICYLSSDTAGQTLSGGDVTDVAIGTDGTLLAELAADQIGLFVSGADGDLDVDVTVGAADTAYFNVIMPNGEVKTCATGLNCPAG
jgi:hypothetical protein